MEELEEKQQDIISTMDSLRVVNGSEFYDDFISVHQYDSDAHSTPATVGSNDVEKSIVIKQSRNDNNDIISTMQKQILDLQLHGLEEEIELAQHYMLPPTFYNYKTKPPCPGCRGCEDNSDVPTTNDVPKTSDVAATSDPNTVPPIVTSTLITTTPVLFGASGGGLQSFASLAKTAEFQFGYEGDKKSFAGAGTMLFQSQKPQKEDTEDHVNPEAEVDVDFKPLVSLPDTYQVTTGQESERQLFCERAKLYRYDPDSKQWKERGIGNMTIMKNSESGKSRLVMRREQVLKLCCNHVILPTMQLNPMLGGGNAWRWFTPCDFSEDERKAEQLAIRFKKKEQADSFQEVISRCVQESTSVTVDKDAS